VDFTGGRAIINAAGVLIAQFRGLRFPRAKKLLLDLLHFLCENFNWLPEDELFSEV
jgi:hypothetical protein